MAGIYKKCFVFASVVWLVAGGAAAYGDQTTKAKRKTSAKHEQPAPAPAPLVQPTGPLTPLTLQQTPALPAEVEYSNGQLTINARNSTMGDILRLVRTRTGAAMDYPPNVVERVVGRFGPGPPRDVLSTLLTGSGFNYAILGSATDPNSLEKVIITKGNSSATQAAAPPQGPRAFGGFQQANQAEFQSADSEQADQFEETTSQDDDEADAANRPQQPVGTPQPAQQPQQSQSIKTPEQLLQELQRQQQMQIQQMQQQGGGPQNFAVPEQPPTTDQATPIRRDHE